MQCNLSQTNAGAIIRNKHMKEMKDILLLATVSLLMSIGATLPTTDENIAQITLPEVQITTSRLTPAMPEIDLPTVTIRAAKPEIATLPLPEVVITATKLRKV